MREILFTAPSYNELQAIFLARQLYLPMKLPHYTKEEQNDIYMRFFKGYDAFKGNKELKEVMDELTDYRHALKTVNIEDYQVRTMSINFFILVINFFNSLGWMCFAMTFALPGLIMLGPLGLLIAYQAEKERKLALAGSDVKVKGTDVMASYKALSCFLMYPVYLTVFTSFFYYICDYHLELSFFQSVQLSMIFALLFPVYSISKDMHLTV